MDTEVDTSFHFVLKNSVAFRDFWGPSLWTTDQYRHTRYYQYSAALAESALVLGGRGWGKSKDLEFSLMQDCLRPRQEILLTAWRRAHVSDRMMTLIDWMRRDEFLGSLVPKTRGEPSIQKQPRFEIHFMNGTVLYGASVGDDPLAANIQGPHPQIRYIEEAQFYPRTAFEKFQSTAHEAGTKDRVYGIRDGRRDTPLYEMDMSHDDYPLFDDERYAIPQIMSPYFNEADQRRKIRALGGDDTPEYLNQVLAKWGEPMLGAWKLEDIIDCMDSSQRMKFARITPKSMESTPPAFVIEGLSKPPDGVKSCLLCVDPAYSEATTAMCFWLADDNKWHAEWVLEIKNKVDSVTSAEILALLFREMRGNQLAVDVTGGDGRGIRNDLLDDEKSWSLSPSQVIGVGFNETVVTGVVIEEDDWGPVGVAETREDTARNNSIITLRRLFADRSFWLPYSQKVLDDFISETRKMGARDWKLVVPRNVHIPEVFRVFSHAWFLRNKTEGSAEEDDYGNFYGSFARTGVMGKRNGRR